MEGTMMSATAMASTNQISDHGEREGRADYLGRAQDVARGSEASEWAWPYSGADEAYVNAVGAGAICSAIGIPATAWDDIAEEWCSAFRRGYEAAHQEHLVAELDRYALETGKDIGADRAAGIRAMRDEPQEVAAGVGCTADEVIVWCNAQEVQ